MFYVLIFCLWKNDDLGLLLEENKKKRGVYSHYLLRFIIVTDHTKEQTQTEKLLGYCCFLPM